MKLVHTDTFSRERTFLWIVSKCKRSILLKFCNDTCRTVNIVYVIYITLKKVLVIRVFLYKPFGTHSTLYKNFLACFILYKICSDMLLLRHGSYRMKTSDTCTVWHEIYCTNISHTWSIWHVQSVLWHMHTGRKYFSNMFFKRAIVYKFVLTQIRFDTCHTPWKPPTRVHFDTCYTAQRFSHTYPLWNVSNGTEYVLRSVHL